MTITLRKKITRCAECGGEHEHSELTEGLCPVALFELAESTRPNPAEADVFGVDWTGVPDNDSLDSVNRHHLSAHSGLPPVSLLAIPGYTVGSELARGGMGIVYRARQHATDREVALKMLLPFSAALPELRERFQLEVRTLADLDHPAILPVYETGSYEGLPWFTMKLATGGSLAARLPTFSGRWRDIAALVATLADAAQFAHERGVLHRDLKPANILFDGDARPFLADFGLAKLIDGESDFTLTRHAMGTPDYLAPEVAATSARHATTASDVYGLGAILFELLTGRPPFQAEGIPALLGRIVREEARFPVQPDGARIPRDLQVIAMRCLAKDPGRRYASARDLADELRRYLAGEPIRARPASTAEKTWRWIRREPALAAALAACAFILVLGIAGILQQLRLTEAARAVAVQKVKAEQAQRARAEAAQSNAERTELAMRQNLYAADMLAAQRALDQNDLGTARVLLEAHRPTIGQADLRGFEWRYFWEKARGQSFASLKPAETGVTAVRFSADGSTLALGSWQTFLYKMPSLELQSKIETPSIQSLAFVPGTSSIIVGMRGPSDVRRWNPGDKGLPTFLLDPQGRWPNIAMSPRGDVMAVGIDAEISGWPEGSTTIYDVAAGTPRQALPESGGMVHFSPDGKLIATGSWQGKIKLWDPATGALVQTLEGAPHTVSLRFAPDSRSLVACTHSHGVLLYDLATGVARPMARGHTETVWDAEISPDGRRLATCSGDQSVRVWEMESGQQIAELRGHSYTIWHVAWSPDGKILASGGQDGARFWNLEAAQAVENPLPGTVRETFFSADTRWLAVTHPENGVALYEYPKLKIASAARASGFPLRFVPERNELVTFQQRTGSPAEILRWSVPELRLLSTVELPDSRERLILPALAPTGRWLIAGSAPNQIGFWDLEKGICVGHVPAPFSGIKQLRAVAISRTGRYSATSFHDWPVVHIVDYLDPDKPVQSMTARHRGQVTSLAFSSDERTLVSSDSDKFIKIWDVETGKERATLLGHRLAVIDVDLSPDGRTIVSSSEDGTVRLWNVETHREVGRFEGNGVMEQVTFAPDGNALLLTTRASADRPSTTSIWRAPTLAESDLKPSP